MRGVVLFLLVLAAACTQYVPIPKNPYGLTVGDPEGNLHIQAFYDLACPDSKTVDTVLQSVFKTISMTKSSIKFTYNMFPLPYHLYAFKTTQAYEYIFNRSSASTSQKFIRYVFDNQGVLDEKNWLTKTVNQFIDEMSKNVSVAFNVSETDLKASLTHGSKADAMTRYEWKYGTSLGVSGTPLFYANGIRIDGAEDWKYGQWINFFTNYTGADRDSTL